VVDGSKRHWSGIWRIPNDLLEPRGHYFGRLDENIARVSRWRSRIAVLTLLVIPLAYPQYARGLARLLSGPLTQSGYTAFNVVANLLGSLIESAAFGCAALVLFAAILVVLTKRGHRRAAIRQLRWPFRALGFLVLWFGGSTLLIDLLGPVVLSVIQRELDAVRIVLTVLRYCISALALTFTLKILYLTATCACCADDGHPALAPFMTTAVVWTIAGLAAADGVHGLPNILAALVLWTGPVLTTGISFWACWRIAHQHRQLFFRAGPPASRY